MKGSTRGVNPGGTDKRLLGCLCEGRGRIFGAAAVAFLLSTALAVASFAQSSSPTESTAEKDEKQFLEGLIGDEPELGSTVTDPFKTGKGGSIFNRQSEGPEEVPAEIPVDPDKIVTTPGAVGSKGTELSTKEKHEAVIYVQRQFEKKLKELEGTVPSEDIEHQLVYTPSDAAIKNPKLKEYERQRWIALARKYRLDQNASRSLAALDKEFPVGIDSLPDRLPSSGGPSGAGGTKDQPGTVQPLSGSASGSGASGAADPLAHTGAGTSGERVPSSKGVATLGEPPVRGQGPLSAAFEDFIARSGIGGAVSGHSGGTGRGSAGSPPRSGSPETSTAASGPTIGAGQGSQDAQGQGAAGQGRVGPAEGSPGQGGQAQIGQARAGQGDAGMASAESDSSVVSSGTGGASRGQGSSGQGGMSSERSGASGTGPAGVSGEPGQGQESAIGASGVLAPPSTAPSFGQKFDLSREIAQARVQARGSQSQSTQGQDSQGQGGPGGVTSVASVPAGASGMGEGQAVPGRGGAPAASTSGSAGGADQSQGAQVEDAQVQGSEGQNGQPDRGAAASVVSLLSDFVSRLLEKARTALFGGDEGQAGQTQGPAVSEPAGDPIVSIATSGGGQGQSSEGRAGVSGAE